MSASAKPKYKVELRGLNLVINQK